MALHQSVLFLSHCLHSSSPAVTVDVIAGLDADTDIVLISIVIIIIHQ